MTRKEYEDKIKILKINLDRLNIIIDRKTNIPLSTGCYFENGQWILYSIDERQNFLIVEKGEEEKIFKFLYIITLGKAESIR